MVWATVGFKILQRHLTSEDQRMPLSSFFILDSLAIGVVGWPMSIKPKTSYERALKPTERSSLSEEY